MRTRKKLQETSLMLKLCYKLSLVTWILFERFWHFSLRSTVFLIAHNIKVHCFSATSPSRAKTKFSEWHFHENKSVNGSFVVSLLIPCACENENISSRTCQSHISWWDTSFGIKPLRRCFSSSSLLFSSCACLRSPLKAQKYYRQIGFFLFAFLRIFPVE